MTTTIGEVTMEDVLASPPPGQTVQRTSSVRLVSSPINEDIGQSRDIDTLHGTREYVSTIPFLQN